MLQGPPVGPEYSIIKKSKGIHPMTNNTDEFLSFELYSEDELKELQQQSEEQDYADSIPTFAELNSSLL